MKDMVRDLTPSGINKAVDEATLETLKRYENASPEEVEARIKELEESWDIECYVQLGSALLTLGGIALGFKYRKALFAPLVVQGLVLSHSLPFADPLSPLLRMLGVWTRQEIEREKQALKLMRGDFERVEKDGSPKSALAAAQGTKGIKEATGEGKNTTRRAAKPRGGKMPLSESAHVDLGQEGSRPVSEMMGEDMRPSDVPTVSGPSGDPERLH